MTKTPALVFLIAPLLAVGVALSMAGTRQVTPEPAIEAAGAPATDWLARPVTVVGGFIPAGRQDRTPAFDVRNCPLVDEIYDLAPARDEVPALLEPRFTTAAEASWLADDAPVLGLRLGSEARCYPLAVLNWHSLVHDTIGGQAIYVFWDPPSGAALARRVWASSRPMGLSGLGYRGFGLTYQLSNGALWDMPAGRPISYPGKPADFAPQPKDDYQWLPLERMTWGAWRQLHANTTVLSQETGYEFDYSLDPYTTAATGPGGQTEDYWTSDAMLAPEALRDAEGELPDKDWVLGFRDGESCWAVSLRELALSGQAETTIHELARTYTIRAWPGDDRFEVTGADGQWLPQMRCFWFAWKARFPEARLWRPEGAAVAAAP